MGDEEDVIRHHGIGFVEAFEKAVNGALANMPKTGEVVGVQVTIAYVTPTMEPGTVEACGSSISKNGYPLNEIARLFSVYAEARWKGWAQDPQTERRSAVRAPRRRPRRTPT